MLNNLFGPRPTRAQGDVPAYSPTVVNINRMRAKSRRKKFLLIGIIVCGLVLCGACGLISSWYTTNQHAPPSTPAAATGVPATLPPGWTPVAGRDGLNGSVSYMWVTFTPTPIK